MEEKWNILKSEYVYKCKWITLRKDEVKMPSGYVIPDFYVLEYPHWVNVIAITSDGKILLEKQYRHGLQEYCYELPAGVVDVGEEPLIAAQRELQEETGYTGGRWSVFMKTAPNASAMNNYCYTFLADGVEPTGETALEVSEDIDTLLVTKEELVQLLENGGIIEADMVAPVWKYLALH